MNPTDYVNPDRVNSPLDPSGEYAAAWKAVRDAACNCGRTATDFAIAQNTIDALRAADSDNRKTIAGLRQSSHIYRVRADRADSDIRKLTRFNDGLTQDAVEARRQLGECRDECARLRATNADLRKSLTHEHTGQTSLVKCRDECNKLRNENESLRSQRDNSMTNTDKASRMVSGLTAELAGLRQRIIELHLQRCDTTEEHSLRDQVAALRAENTRLKPFESRFVSLSRSYKEAIRRLRTTCCDTEEENSLRTQVAALRDQLKTASSANDEKGRYIDGLLQTLDTTRQKTKSERARADANYDSWSKASRSLTKARLGLEAVKSFVPDHDCDSCRSIKHNVEAALYSIDS